MSRNSDVALKNNNGSTLPSAQKGICQTDLGLNLISCDQVIADIFGLDPAGMDKTNLRDFFNEKALQCFHLALRGEIAQTTTLVKDKDSKPNRFIRIQCGPVRSLKKEITGLFGIIEAFEGANPLLNSNITESLDSAACWSEDKIVLLTADGKIESLFGRWFEKYQINPRDIIGKTHREVFGDLPGKLHEEALKKAAAGKFSNYRWDCTYGNEISTIKESISPIKDQNNNIIGFLGIGSDVTDLKKIETTLNQKANQLEALYNAGRKLGRTLNLEQNHEALHQSLRDNIPCDGFFISTYNPAQNMIRCQSAWADGVKIDTSTFPELPLEKEGHGTQSLAIRLGESIILNDYEASLRSAETVHHVNPEGSIREEIPADEERARSAMIIPLKLESEVIGVLQIFSYQLNAFTEEHLKLAEAMAFHGAAAQNNSLLYKMAEDEVIQRSRSEQLRNALYRISQTAHATDSLDDLLDTIYSIIAEVLPASSFYFAFLDRDNSLLSFPYFHDDYDTRPFDRKVGKGLTEYVLRSGKTYLWRSTQADPTEKGEIEVLGRDAAVWLGVPLMDKDHAIGVMAVQHYTNENAYGDREREILDFVATEVSRAIIAMQAVKSIRESEDKYRSLIENTREGIFLWSGDRLELVNQQFCELFGYSSEQLLSSGFDSSLLIAETDRERAVQMAISFQRGESTQYQLEFMMLAANNREFEAEISTNVLTYKGKFAVQGVIRDISQRRLIEAQLLQTAKLEAIGRLAGGVAHDFNNLLTALSGTAELMLLRITPDNPNFNDLEQILTIARRGSNLTQQLLAFARSQPQQPKVFQLNSMVEGTQQMLRRLIGDAIKLTLHIDPALPTVKADHAQLEMALMNLIVNSRDAMTSGGEISITTRVEKVGEEDRELYSGADAVDYVALVVSDQGTGMPKEVLDRATDPFFTTKPIGKGTGLGLSTVHGIVRQNGGILNISSEVGVGTTVKILLPISGELVVPDLSTSSFGESVEGRETILVCDDEDSVRQVAVRLLRTKGYEVLEATEGQHALEVADAYLGKIDLLLTDMAMPVMGGPELAHHLTERRPGLKVVMMSGYSPMAFPSDYDFSEPKDFIQKPFRAHQLTAKVREILNRQDTAEPNS